MLFTLPALVAVATMPAFFQDATNGRSAPSDVRPTPAHVPLSARDSVRALKAARRAQGDFESVRKQLLPRQEGMSGRACDVVIGRFCRWQQARGAGPPPEAPKVIERRERLLTTLDSIGRRVPGDRWVIAQRFRYRMEADRAAEAEQMAKECGARAPVAETRRWCQALVGYAAQERGDYVGAEAAFASALAEMPDQERCAWQDVTYLLEGKAAGQFKKAGCAGRDSAFAALWRLVQPLYLTGVNDLRTEFLARVTRMYIEKDSRTPLSYSQGPDDRETLLRYGGGMWYTRDDGPPGALSSMPSTTVASHRRGPSFNFFPVAKALASLEQLTLDDWEYSGLAPRTAYAPTYADQFYALPDHQVAVFRRGDSALIVAAFDVTDAASFPGSHVQAGIFAAPLVNGGVAPPIGAPIKNPGPTAISVMHAPWKPMIVSLEVLDPDTRIAGRARYAVKLPSPGGRLSLSDLLLYAPRDSTPHKLDEAVPNVLRAPRVSRTQRLGLFWETYGVRAGGETLTYAVRVEPIGQGWMKKTFTKLKLREKDSALSLQWQEVAEVVDAIASRGLALDLSPLKPGRYRVRLSLTTSATMPPITAERTIEVGQ